MKQKTFDLADPQVERLAIEASRRGISVPELLRRLIDIGLDAMGTPWPEHRESTCQPLAGHRGGVRGGLVVASEQEEGRGEKKTRSKRTPSTLPDTPQDLSGPEWGGKVRFWLEYKAERGFHYKPRGLEALFTQLRAMGPRVGVPSILHAAGNGWQGIKRLSGRDLDEQLALVEPAVDPELAWRTEEVWADRVYAYREFLRDLNGAAPTVDPVLTPDLRRLIEAALRTYDGELLAHEARDRWRRDSIARAAGIGHFYSGWHTGKDDRTKGEKQLGHDLPWRNGNCQKFADLYFENRAVDEAKRRAR